MHQSPVTANERTFDDSEVIVSKTDIHGKLTYANPLFLDLAGCTEAEAIGQPHSMIRHPDMPRCIFQLLWDTIQAGREIFAYVKNRSMNGDFYWVFAHVTPSFDQNGALCGYHSNRRSPNRDVLSETIIPLYRQLLKEEHRHGNRKEGLKASTELLTKLLDTKGMSYDEFVHSLQA